MASSVSLEAKKAYIRKSRSANYTASLRLEGFKVDSPSSSTGSPKSKLIEKYTSRGRTSNP